MVGAEPFLAVFAVDKRVGKTGQMAGSFPYLRVHEDGGVEAHDVAAAVHHGAPPRLLDVALELDAERAVVPAAVEAAVNFARLEDKTAPLAQAYDGAHQIQGSVPPSFLRKCYKMTGKNKNQINIIIKILYRGRNGQ